MRRLEGIFPPAATPFDADGDVDCDAFRANLRTLMARGLHGVVVAGSNGEAPLLDEAERTCLVQCAREVVPADRWLIAGIGGESTRQTIARARAAAEHGADVMLVAAPHYFGPQMTPAALLTHFTAVAEASPAPIVLYNIPKYVHFAIPAEVVAALAGHPNVAGVKDSSGDEAQRTAYLGALAGRGVFLTGAAHQLADAMAEGAAGGIVAVSQFVTALTLQVYEAARVGDRAQALAHQATLAPLAREIVGGLAVPGLKVAMDLTGLVGGHPRPPLLPLDDAGRARVRELLAPHGVLVA
ncbi:MAG: dihydrodipicolinate synthase family protein [Gemmatimonadaceae bacterium]|jgi:4-hydroxy-2-oxoglutarate aldolase|nr:dihydrodipicolinate synthase family protein [Gemmatimonadaceae bacterium]